MSEQPTGRRQLEEMLDRIERAIDQEPSNDKLERVRRLIVAARESLDVDMNDPIAFRDAVVASVKALEAEFGSDAVKMGNLIQARLGNRAFPKTVAKVTDNMKRLRQRWKQEGDED